MIDPNVLKSIFSYDPLTGDIRWKIDANSRARAGAIAGCIRDGGRYRSVSVFGKRYQAHRIAWAIFHGEWPEKFIDHIDGNGLNNQIKNLRDVSHQTNCMNLARSKVNTSGVSGVYWHKKAKKWHAQVSHKGRVHYLGLFEKIDDAKSSVDAKRAEFGFHENHCAR